MVIEDCIDQRPPDRGGHPDRGGYPNRGGRPPDRGGYLVEDPLIEAEVPLEEDILMEIGDPLEEEIPWWRTS